MNGQLSLFSEDNLNRNKYYQNLEDFNLKAAIENLKKWGQAFNPPSDLDQRAESLNWLQDQLKNRLEPSYLAWLYQTADRMQQLQPLQKDMFHLKRGICKMLYERLHKNAFDFIAEDLHPAEIFIRQNDLEAAGNSLENYFGHYGEHPYLRELQAYVHWQRKEIHAAMEFYTFAVFADPFSLKEKYLKPKTFRRKLEALRHKFSDENKARARWAFELWRDGQTYIGGNRQSFEIFLKNKEQQLSAKPNDLICKTLRFSALLFLAESERLRAYPNRPGASFTLLQEQMRNLNYEQYVIYINTLKSFRNI